MVQERDADSPDLEWLPELAVGIPEMDADHQMLFVCIKAVVAAIDAQRPRQEIDATFAELMTGMIGHFAREERMLVSRGYEYADGHALQHAHILEELGEIKATYLYDTDQAALEEVREFLAGWLASHIIDHDFGYRDHFARQPSSQES